MSQQAAHHHRKAAEHHEHAAKHHREAADHHESGNHERQAIMRTPPTASSSTPSHTRPKPPHYTSTSLTS
jgi:hypothetical protein